MNSRQVKRQRWFDKGAEALNRATNGRFEGLYLCPLCCDLDNPDCLFKKEDLLSVSPLLTFEDVPPRSSDLGGEALLLTCKKCNDWAGHELDHHLEKLANLKSFTQGELRKDRPVKVSANGIEANVSLKPKDDKIIFDVQKNKNDPKKLPEFEKAFTGLKKNDRFKVNFIRDSFSTQRAVINLLRAAYLAAFSVFGYRYILGEALGIVRSQIRNPDEKIIPVFRSTNEAKDPRKKLIAFINEPPLHSGLMVQLGRDTFHLPFNPDDTTFYSHLEDTIKEHPSITMKATVLDWPTQPEYRRDFNNI